MMFTHYVPLLLPIGLRVGSGQQNSQEKTPLAIAFSIAPSADQKGKSEPSTKKLARSFGKNFYLRTATYVRCVRRGPCCPRGPPPCPLSRPSPATPSGVAPQYRSNLSPRARGGLPRGIRGRGPLVTGSGGSSFSPALLSLVLTLASCD